MTYRVVLQPRAEQDVREAARWLRDRSRSTSTALRWARNIRARIETLAVSPLRCPVDPDSEAYGEEVRVLLYGKRRGTYRVLFAVRGDTVHVLTVRHAARQGLAQKLDQEEEDAGGPQAGPIA